MITVSETLAFCADILTQLGKNVMNYVLMKGLETARHSR
jgi:hypothetical protein